MGCLWAKLEHLILACPMLLEAKASKDTTNAMLKNPLERHTQTANFRMDLY